MKEEFEALSERYERMKKIVFPLQEQVVECAANALKAIQAFVDSGKQAEEREQVRLCLDRWRAVLDELQNSKSH
jgi:hypothetical protein